MIINALQQEKEYEKLLKTGGFIGQKIMADFVSQKKSATNMFYILDNCAIMMSGENLSLCGSVTNDNVEEILSFCNFAGVKTIESQILNLPLEVEKKMIIMEYAKDKTLPQSCDNAVKNGSIYSFIKFCCNNFYGIDFDNVYSNFTRKVNCQIANIYCITEKDKIISGAISTEYMDNTAYITFVSTDKEYRNQGFAKKIIDHIISQNSDKRILLKCEKQLMDFYAKLGFKAIDTITINRLKDK